MSKPLHENVCEDQLFDSLFRKHSKDLGNFLYYKYGEALNPKDKVQDAFIKLWENCAKVTPNKAKSFLFTVANNMMLNETKHQKVVLKFKETKPKSYTNENPEFLMEEDQYKLKIETAINNLTDAQRVAFLMNRVEGKRFKEISTLLGISIKAVEKRIYGAVKKLKQEIEELN